MPFARAAAFRRIAWQLPLSIAGVLLAVVGLFSWAAYREVRYAVVAAAGDRLDDASRQLAGLLGQSAQARVAETRRLAADPAVVSAVAASGERGGAGLAILQRFLQGSETVEAVEVWDVAAHRVAQVVRERPPDQPAIEGTYPTWAADTVAVSGFRDYGRTVGYEIAVPVTTPAGSRGYVVQRRRLGSAQQANRLLTDLIGSQAAILIGTPGGTWIDLSRATEGPPPGTGPEVREYQREGVRRLGASRPIPGTPWVIWTELPSASVVQRANAFLGRIAPAGLVIVVIGGTAAWGLSGRLTGPLERIRSAATAMASGDLAQQVTPGGPGELRELGRAFNTMASRIGAAQHGLEEQIAERTSALQRYAADLEAANRELEAFSYSVSHDLRTPLRAIHGFSQALLEDSRDRLDDQGADYLRRVCAAADRMALLIDDLLELSRVTRSEMRVEPVNLSQIAHRVAADLGQGKTARKVEWRIADGLEATGDPRLLRLALQNLLDNAWKFTSKRERATIEVGRVNGPDTAFYVRDDGAGFDMVYAEKLFGVFQRLHAPSEFPGTGVGLAIVQRVVHRHGGRVWADAAPERGATIYFTLPGPSPAGDLSE